MTVSYVQHMPESSLRGVTSILAIWRGSIYKGIWKPLTTYCLIYLAFSVLYRHLLPYHEYTKEAFERWCVYIATYEELIPLNFILGFYVSQVRSGEVTGRLARQVLAQWWKQFSCAFWVDTLGMDIGCYLPGPGRAKEVGAIGRSLKINRSCNDYWLPRCGGRLCVWSHCQRR
jgi:hypothetical protein